MAGFQPSDQLQTVNLRHTDIGNDNVQLKGRKLIQQMLAVRISADNIESAALFADHPGQAFAN
ncbi:hypothetical protein D3C86_2142290 [compost metagenome]